MERFGHNFEKVFYDFFSFLLNKAQKRAKKLTKRLTPSICDNHGLFLMTKQLILALHYGRYDAALPSSGLN